MMIENFLSITNASQQQYIYDAYEEILDNENSTSSELEASFEGHDVVTISIKLPEDIL